jgi:hypothetical protein
MSFSKNDLDKIKSKISIRNEIEKKVKLFKKEKIIGVVVLFMKKKRHLVKLMKIRILFIVLAVQQKGIFLQFTLIYIIIVL